MKTPLIVATLLFASVSLFGAVAGGGSVPPTTPTTPTTPTAKPPCTKPGVTTPAAPKAPEKKEAEKKCDDAKRPFKK
ncbi:MAG: hypothetical protein ACR2KA_05660 [Opitutales bacterium]|jgi:hypothetical protein